jgi:glycosyltransferase involved in cell wall biosynthesis
MLVQIDTENRYTVQTGLEDAWPEQHVSPIRSFHAGAMPTTQQKLWALAYMVRHARAADLVHVVASLHHPPPAGMTLLRAWRSRVGRPLIHTIPSLGRVPLDPRTLIGDVTVVVSEYSRRLLQQHGITNVVRIYPPLDERLLRPAESVAEVAARLNLGTRAVLYPGHYGAESGIEEMLRAFAALPPDLADAVLVLASRPRVGQDPAREAERVIARAQELGLGSRVRVLGNIDDMPGLISATAVTVLVPQRMSSKMDLPLVLLEAQALRRPVIVSQDPPMVETLIGEGGLAVRHGDIPELAASVTALLRSPELRCKLSIQGQAAVLQHCDPAQIIKHYHHAYAMALNHEAALVRRAAAVVERDVNGS